MSAAGRPPEGLVPATKGSPMSALGPVPLLACDAHLHILDQRYAAVPAGMAFEDYRACQQRLGTQRAVPVQAKLHGTDPACLLDALARFGPTARGIAVVLPTVDDATLRRLDAGGVRGLRFSVWNPKDTVTTVDMIEPLAARIAALGWHAQVHMSGAQLVTHAELLGRLPCPLVIDHMGRLPPAAGVAHAGFEVMRRLLDRGDTWVKLSGAYLNTSADAGYADATRVAQALVRAAPERLVWGSDWPHLTESHKPAAQRPDSAGLLALLDTWAGDLATRDRILVDNPGRLYGFH